MTENKQHEVRINPQDLSRMYTTSHHVLSVLSFQLTVLQFPFLSENGGGGGGRMQTAQKTLQAQNYLTDRKQAELL